MGKLLILLGVVLIVVGLIVQYGVRLPGDIYVEKKNFKFYFPIMTSIVISIILTLIMYLINRFRN